MQFGSLIRIEIFLICFDFNRYDRNLLRRITQPLPLQIFYVQNIYLNLLFPQILFRVNPPAETIILRGWTFISIEHQRYLHSQKS